MSKVIQLTNEKFTALDFRIGDIFHEYFSIFLFIANIENNILTIVLGECEIKYFTKEEFRKYCQYSTNECYLYDYLKNDYGFIKLHLNFLNSTQKYNRRLKIFKVLTKCDTHLAAYNS